MNIHVTLADGTPAEITLDEGRRIFREIGSAMNYRHAPQREANAAYRKKAVEHIKTADKAHMEITDEAGLKETLVRNLPPGFGKREVELLYEAMEFIAADHYAKITRD